MQCREVQRALAEYSVDALSVAEAQHVRRHLENCTDCLAEWQVLVGSLRLLDSMPKQDPPRDLWPAIAAAIAAAITVRTQRRPEPTWTPARTRVHTRGWWEALRGVLTRRRVVAATVAASAVLFGYAWRGRTAPQPQWVIEPAPIMASSSSYMRGYFLSTGDQPFFNPIARGMQASLSERMIRQGGGSE